MYQDASYYLGYWVRGSIEGYGQYYHPSGLTYVGEWLDNNMHGWGNMVKADGTQIVGYWYEGQPYNTASSDADTIVPGGN